jgi:hypothetical protein
LFLLTDNVIVHIVLNDFGNLGRAFIETDEAEADECNVADALAPLPPDEPEVFRK